MSRYTQAPRFTECKFDTLCHETGRAIKKGEQMAYYPNGKRCYHAKSKQAEELRGQQFARSYSMADAEF